MYIFFFYTKLFYFLWYLLHSSQHSRRPPSYWQCPLRRWPMHSPKRAAQDEWRGARVTIPLASSIEKRGSGGSAATTWNIAPSSSRSSSAKRGSARTWGLRLTPTTSTLEFGWVASQVQGVKSITYTWATLGSISWATILHDNYTSDTLLRHQRIQNCNLHLHIFHAASQTNAPLFATVVGLGW